MMKRHNPSPAMRKWYICYRHDVGRGCGDHREILTTRLLPPGVAGHPVATVLTLGHEAGDLTKVGASFVRLRPPFNGDRSDPPPPVGIGSAVTRCVEGFADLFGPLVRSAHQYASLLVTVDVDMLTVRTGLGSSGKTAKNGEDRYCDSRTNPPQRRSTRPRP